MNKEYLSIETAKKLANYNKLEKELNETKEKLKYYKSEWQNVTRLVVSKQREINELKKNKKGN